MRRYTKRSRILGPAGATAVGQRILQVRQEMGLTQKQLAEPQLTASYISHIESGKSRPSLKTLSFLAERLNRPVTFFLVEDGSAATSQTASSGGGSLAQAYTLYAQGSYSASRDLLRTLHAVNAQPTRRAEVLALLGRAERRSGDTEAAIASLAEARKLAQAKKDSVTDAALAVELSAAYEEQGQWGQAHALNAETYNAIRQSPSSDPLVTLAVVGRYAHSQAMLDQPEAVLELYKEHESLLRTATDPQALIDAYVSDTANNETPYMVEMLHALATLIEAVRATATLQVLAGEAAQAKDSNRLAQDLFNEALQSYRVTYDWAGATATLCRLAELAVQAQAFDQAQKYVTEAATLASQHTDDRLKAEVLLVQAQLETALNDSPAADAHFGQALALARAANAFDLQQRLYLSYSQALHTWGRLDEALSYLMNGTSLITT